MKLKVSKMSDKWQALQQKVKAKRQNRGRGGSSGGSKVNLKELTVQRMSSEVGKAQKYARTGPREFVSFTDDGDQVLELTLENIKEACVKHFESSLENDMVCDVLAGERGPSCKTLEQVPDCTKVIFVRFIQSKPEFELSRRRSSATATSASANGSRGEGGPLKRKRPESDSGNDSNYTGLSDCAVSTKSKCVRDAHPGDANTSSESKFVPRSLSITDMLKLGKIKDTRLIASIIEIHTFDMEDFTWSKMTTPVEFFEEKVPLGSGSFRDAYKATSKHPMCKDKTWVVKHYNAMAMKSIAETGQTVEGHTKKVVQMHILARNFASQLDKKVAEENVREAFGNTLSYKNIFYGKTDKNECVTIEEYVPGSFKKYLNNDGLVCTVTANNHEATKKAECLSHFSYEKSQQRLLLVDIQGSGYQCFDPEIASDRRTCLTVLKYYIALAISLN